MLYFGISIESLRVTFRAACGVACSRQRARRLVPRPRGGARRLFLEPLVASLAARGVTGGDEPLHPREPQRHRPALPPGVPRQGPAGGDRRDRGYIGCFQHATTALRATMPGVRIEWAVSKAGVWTFSVLDAYLGDAYVDLIGAHYYDVGSQFAKQRAFSNETLNV